MNQTELASPASFFSAAKAKELSKAAPEEVIALLDSCIARCQTPITSDLAPYLLERAQMYMNVEKYRLALADYDAYFNAVKVVSMTCSIITVSRLPSRLSSSSVRWMI